MNEKPGRSVVSNIKAWSARRVDTKTSVVGCGGSGIFFFVLFGSRDKIFGPDNMLAALRYTIDMNDVFPRCSAPRRATKGFWGTGSDPNGLYAGSSYPGVSQPTNPSSPAQLCPSLGLIYQGFARSELIPSAVQFLDPHLETCFRGVIGRCNLPVQYLGRSWEWARLHLDRIWCLARFIVQGGL